ncbi:MFS general substrate transporter [Aureobasidium pullulans]|uniref:MFS general substrate transporter n=1 Tax=Aureobasidium pullulans TaxID=5580 RepID=A0A4S8VAU7_AURPU|nr:MFS general substrate transporter [Aureobasidium pullulans]THW60129.1 MFS general substrate transporter [Aureobasidium pullulans]THY01572.1 MFS general substrate transporter [Aureobasidium pullulans]
MPTRDYDLDVPGTEQLVDVNHDLDTAHQGSSDIVLIPRPTECGSDPLTWSRWKKWYQLFLLALYACAFSFGENTLGAAWTTVSEDTGVSLVNMNGGSALNYLLLGLCNIWWISTANKIGRRPVFLLTTLICCMAGVWQGRVHGTAQWFLSNSLNGVGTSAYQAVIQLSVFDTFFAHERGMMLSFYLFGQQLGSILGLITGGIISDQLGWRWTQYIVAIIDAGVLVLLFFTFEETMFPRFIFETIQGVLPVTEGRSSPTESATEGKDVDKKDLGRVTTVRSEAHNVQQRDYPRRTYVQKLKLWVYFPEDKTTYMQYFRRPFALFLFPNVVISGCIFAFGCTAGIVSFNTISEILTEPPYDWSTSSTGLVFLAALVGNFVGWGTGVLSDQIVLRLARRNGGVKEPEMRLWTLCFSFVYAAIGYMMYGWGAQTGAHWMTIAFGVGCMIAHQVSACSIATTYAMECFPGISGELVVVLAICSSCINFAISYSVQPFIEAAGYGYAFLFFGLCVLCSMLAAIPMAMFGKSWRRRCAPKWRQWLSQREN